MRTSCLFHFKSALFPSDSRCLNCMKGDWRRVQPTEHMSGSTFTVIINSRQSLMIDVSFATLSSYDLNMRHVLRCVIDFFHAVISQCRSMGKGNGSYIAIENIKMLTKNDDRHADLLFCLWQASLFPFPPSTCLFSLFFSYHRYI